MAKQSRSREDEATARDVVRGAGRQRRINIRKKGNYSNAKHGMQQGGGVMPSDYCFNTRKHNLQVIYPNSKGGLVYFRPFAALDKQSSTPVLLPGRELIDAGGQSEWIVKVAVCKYVGTVQNARCSYVLYLPDHKEEKQKDPYVVLYNACFAAKERGQVGRGARWNPKWSALLTGSKQEGAKMSAPDHMWVAQGLCYMNDDKVYVSQRGRDEPMGARDDDPLTVVVMSSGAGRALLRLLDTPRKNIDAPDEDDLDNNFKYGSAVGKYNEETRRLEGGLIIGLFRPNGKTRIERLAPFSAKGKSDLVVTSFSGQLKDIQGYEVSLHRSLMIDKTVYSASLSEKETDANFNKAQFFFPDDENDDGVIEVLPLERRLELLANAFKDQKGLLKFGWYGHDEFWTPEVQKILRGTVTSTSPLADDDEDDTEDDDDEDNDRPSRRRSSGRRGDRDERGSRRTSGIAQNRRRPIDEEDEDQIDEDDDLDDDDLDDDLDDDDFEDDADLDEDFDEDDDDPSLEDEDEEADDRRPRRRKAEGGRVMSSREVDPDEFDEDEEPEFDAGDEDEEGDEGDEDEEGDEEGDEDEEPEEAPPPVEKPSRRKPATQEAGAKDRSAKDHKASQAAKDKEMAESLEKAQRMVEEGEEEIASAAGKAAERSRRRTSAEDKPPVKPAPKPAAKTESKEKPAAKEKATAKVGKTPTSRGGSGRRRAK